MLSPLLYQASSISEIMRHGQHSFFETCTINIENLTQILLNIFYIKREGDVRKPHILYNYYETMCSMKRGQNNCIVFDVATIYRRFF